MQKPKNELLNKYYEMGEAIKKFSSCQSIIQIEVDTTLETMNGIEDEGRKLRFLGRQYLDLVDDLRKAGILN